MKRFIICVATLCSFMGQANANVINVEDVTIPQGEQQEIKVLYSLDKADAYVGYAFKLIMPTGISTVKDSNGYPVYTLDENNTGFNLNVTSSDGFGALPKNASVAIDGTEGALLTLTLQADASLEVGSTHVVNISSIMLTEIVDDSQQSVYLEDVIFTVTVGEPTDKHIILDETSTTVPEAATGVDVRVKRTIKANEWGTIVLPFAMTETQCKEAFGDDVELADFTGCSVDDETGDITVNFSDVTAIEANHPYIIKVSAPVTEFTVDGVDIAPEDEPCVDLDEVTTGTGRNKKTTYNSFIGTFVADTEVPDYALFLNDNKFWFSTGNTKMKAFRAYFDLATAGAEYEDGEVAARVFMAFDESETTGIAELDAHNSEFIINNSDAVYNLNGQRMPAPSKGLYIRDGKKVVVK